MSGKVIWIRVAVLAIAIIVALSVYGVEINRTNTIKENCTEAVGGYVVSCETRSTRTKHNSKTRDAYVISASYQVGGATYFAEGSASRPYNVRDSIGVKYDPDDPGVAYVGNDPIRSEVPMIVSAAVILPSVAVFLLTKKRQ